MTTVRGNGGAGGVGRAGALQPRSAMMNGITKRVGERIRFGIGAIILWHDAGKGKMLSDCHVGVSVN